MFSRQKTYAVYSVNLSIPRTVARKAGDGVAMDYSPGTQSKSSRSKAKPAAQVRSGLCLCLLLLVRPVVVGRDRVGREVDLLHRHGDRRPLSLRFIDFLEHRVLLGFARRDAIPGGKEFLQDVGRRVHDVDAVLGPELIDRLGIQALPLGPVPEQGLPGDRLD